MSHNRVLRMKMPRRLIPYVHGRFSSQQNKLVMPRRIGFVEEIPTLRRSRVASVSILPVSSIKTTSREGPNPAEVS
jgi:hypothetical protein